LKERISNLDRKDHSNQEKINDHFDLNPAIIHFILMFLQTPSLGRSSVQASLVCKSLANHVATSHAQTFRFIQWQKQFGLLSSDSSTWSETWNRFHETYKTLINENGLNDFLQSSSNGSMDQLIFHAIHIDVIRLSRYFNLFCEDEEERR
jgi:hypothetical protein